MAPHLLQVNIRNAPTSYRVTSEITLKEVMPTQSQAMDHGPGDHLDRHNRPMRSHVRSTAPLDGSDNEYQQLPVAP